MSRVDDLLAELAPDGVEYRPLGDLVTIKNGKDHKHLSDGDVPVYGSGESCGMWILRLSLAHPCSSLERGPWGVSGMWRARFGWWIPYSVLRLTNAELFRSSCITSCSP